MMMFCLLFVSPKGNDLRVRMLTRRISLSSFAHTWQHTSIPRRKTYNTGRSPPNVGGTTRSSAQHRPHRRANLPARATGPRATETRPRRGTTGSVGHDFRPTGERTIVESKTRQTGQSEGRRTDDTQRGETRQTRKRDCQVSIYQPMYW